jgi:hypothetical protein
MPISINPKPGDGKAATGLTEEANLLIGLIEAKAACEQGEFARENEESKTLIAIALIDLCIGFIRANSLLKVQLNAFVSCHQQVIETLDDAAR